MTKRNAAYKDANFRKIYGHSTATGRPVPVEIYSYEGRSKIYDIAVHSPSQFVCRINMRKAEAGPTHREIDRFFNLGLEGMGYEN